MKILIIEQESESFNSLRRGLEESFASIQVLEHADTIEHAVSLIKKINPDIIFMSFLLKDGDVFEVLKRIRVFDCKICFTSEFNRHINMVSVKSLISLMLNPTNGSKVQKHTLSNNQYFNNNKNGSYSFYNPNAKLFLPKGGEHVAVKTSEIIKCVADGNFTFFYLTGQKHYVSQPIKYYDMLLSDKGFFRINRSVLININYIKSISKKEAIVLTNNEKLMVSRRNKEKLKRLIEHFS
ncbi:LytR/AlgR family response regulator transcription factor [Flagellimonas eckloniae]|uniref:Uncharacterized protein n=1 Tax=Flagellimonas eckloniae TaxID=346185 RepID=A0A0Q0XCV3_9FLAO|nr:LytTR family DNA-binding domain-containing protein [Allomuricauda eckloniae]KQC28980.1 hypothetical protein AAY42_03030 [Allomuricauda eckloniae]